MRKSVQCWPLLDKLVRRPLVLHAAYSAAAVASPYPHREECAARPSMLPLSFACIARPFLCRRRRAPRRQLLRRLSLACVPPKQASTSPVAILPLRDKGTVVLFLWHLEWGVKWIAIGTQRGQCHRGPRLAHLRELSDLAISAGPPANETGCHQHPPSHSCRHQWDPVELGLCCRCRPSSPV